jgi:hypothetical protein
MVGKYTKKNSIDNGIGNGNLPSAQSRDKQLQVSHRAMTVVGFLRKSLAILLLLVLFGARLGAVSYSGFVVPLQDYIAQPDLITEADTLPKVAHFKVKSHGADVPVPCRDFVFIERIFETPLAFPPVPEKDLPEGYVSIFIPPA